MNAVNIENIPSELMEAWEHNPNIIMNPLVNGSAAISQFFRPGFARDKATYTNVEIFDAIRVAGQDFDPQEAIKFGVRKVQLEDYDIDLMITRDAIKNFSRSYLGVMLNTREKTEIERQDFPAYMLQQIITSQFGFLYRDGAWKGVRAVAGRKSGNSVTGLLEKLTVGRATGGDILPGQVHTSAVLTEQNAYEEVNAVAELVRANNSELLNQPLEARMSADTYLKYKRNRRALFSQHVSPSELPTVLDDFSNIRLVQEPALAGKDTIVIASPEMFRFTSNENVGDYALSMVKDVKGWKFNLHFSLCFDYAYGKQVYLNDKV